MKNLLLIFGLITISTAFAEDKTMCGYYGYQEESFTGPEKSWLDMQNRRRVKLDFPGRTPYMNEGDWYCCFGDYEKGTNTLYVKTGCS